MPVYEKRIYDFGFLATNEVSKALAFVDTYIVQTSTDLHIWNETSSG